MMKEEEITCANNTVRTSDAIWHTHEPFKQDYITLHILLRRYDVKSVFEIGTHIGEGTQIICNAVPLAKVYSLDLHKSFSDQSLQHPELKGMEVGQKCKLDYTQFYGDSMSFDYSVHPCEAYFIDGEHTTKNVLHETTQILNCKPNLIIWHDADISDVWNAITECLEFNNEYNLFRVTGTRIAYAIRL